MPSQYPLIFGASGQTGTELIRQFPANAVNARITYREPSELSILRNYNVEPFYADYEQPATVAKAMVGADRVITILPVHSKFAEWGRHIIDCARDAGIKHYTALSNFSIEHGGDSAIARMHAELEQHLISSGIPYTILRPAPYFQNMLWVSITIVRQKRFSLPLENSKIPHIDMRDIAETLIKVSLDEQTHRNKIYTLTGGEALSMFDVARFLSDALGEKIRYQPAPLETAEDSFRALGQVEWMARAVAEVHKNYATLDLSAVTDDFEKICGRPPRTFQSFIQESADVFSGAK